ncbi:hypothetical protein DZK27_15975 [Rhodobacteraceae bacterium 63075]|nr:hypothetical protein DZK27_15975 [Rhodobacteraceae bacterium 63075]
MQIFFKQNLALLAVPKTGTTAYEAALRGEADILFKKRRKHMSAEAFDKTCAPFLRRAYRLTPERVAIMREPLDQLRSWYRYRTREALLGSKKSTAGMSFDAFVRDAIERPAPPHANVGTQWRFLTLKDGTVPLHHLFAYERQSCFLGFLGERFGKAVDLPEANVSPALETEISPETRAAFRAARTEDYALYERILEAGGHLQLEYG